MAQVIVTVGGIDYYYYESDTVPGEYLTYTGLYIEKADSSIEYQHYNATTDETDYFAVIYPRVVPVPVPPPTPTPTPATTATISFGAVVVVDENGNKFDWTNGKYTSKVANIFNAVATVDENGNSYII